MSADYKKEGKLWVKLSEIEKEKQEAEARYKHENLRRLYETYPLVKERADRIHGARLMSNPTCDECIELALKALNFEP